MKLLHFEKKDPRDTPVTVRMPKATVSQLRQLAKIHKVSQSQVLQRLIELAFQQVK